MKTTNRRWVTCGCAMLSSALLLAPPAALQAADGEAQAASSLFALEPASHFSNHMVLQREIDVPVWGTAEPGVEVTIEFAGQIVSGQADRNGTWKIWLNPLQASAENRVMKIGSGEHTVEIQNVLVGDVWVGSGQSNMEQRTHGYVANNPPLDQLVRSAPYDGIRLMQTREERVQNWSPANPKPVWEPANAENILQFSAQMFAFGERLHRELNVPIGLIVGAVGGSSSGWWLPAEIWESSERCQKVIAEFSKTWNRDRAQEVYEEQLARWKKTVEEAKTKGEEPRGRAPKPVVEPGVFRGGKLGECFDRFIRTSVGYGIRGVLWDQGESLTQIHGLDQYNCLSELIRGWRKLWGQGDFPFLFVQKPSGLGNAWTNEDPMTSEANPFKELPHWPPDNGDGRFLYLRLMWDNNNAWMVPAIDLGSNPPIAEGLYPHHPINKWGYGNRAAEVALQKVYQQPNTQAYGPVYESHRIDGPRVIVHFSEVGEGLAFRHANEVRGFALAGKDGKWHWAKATIEDQTVVVTSEAVPVPVRVRYAWGFIRTWANLFNKNGLPALSFQTQ